MTPSQSPAAKPSPYLQGGRRKNGEVGRPLPVAELTDVIVAFLAVRLTYPVPAQKDVICRLHQALAADNALAVIPEFAPTGELLQDRAFGLFRLKYQVIGVVFPDQQQDPGPGPDAPNSHNLARSFDELVPSEQLPAIVGERRQVAALLFGQDAEDSIDFELRIKLGQRHYKRRITDNPRSAVYDLRQLRKGVLVVAIARLGQVLGQPFVLRWLQLALDLRQKVVEIDMGIPDVNRRHRRESVHRHPVLGDGGCRDGLPDGSRVVVDSPRDGKAGDQSLDVPLPWARQRL